MLFTSVDIAYCRAIVVCQVLAYPCIYIVLTSVYVRLVVVIFLFLELTKYLVSVGQYSTVPLNKNKKRPLMTLGVFGV